MQYTYTQGIIVPSTTTQFVHKAVTTEFVRLSKRNTSTSEITGLAIGCGAAVVAIILKCMWILHKRKVVPRKAPAVAIGADASPPGVGATYIQGPSWPPPQAFFEPPVSHMQMVPELMQGSITPYTLRPAWPPEEESTTFRPTWPPPEESTTVTEQMQGTITPYTLRPAWPPEEVSTTPRPSWPPPEESIIVPQGSITPYTLRQAWPGESTTLLDQMQGSITPHTLRPAWPGELTTVPDQERTIHSQVPEIERELENVPNDPFLDVEDAAQQSRLIAIPLESQNAENQVPPAVSGEEQGPVPGAVEGDTAAELREVRQKMVEMMARMRHLEDQIDSERGQILDEPPPDYTDLQVHSR
ncbi:hypothetical protein GYMLUDRAFT_259176 [Collybiopsis luxurians FD-317 M1]|uniref:Unplaced genomic scaffold GYMLUscaffold_14, whole genome shotgun sequence n=1 Tax=Collybiopsis luxurians FD-317 M1 TaxID=944289 RepID=A0A0D0D491_9AGAR|nr:hypothetical protein GYMLUDRAFT_259176 [Collybiopsis luxurians FD-317 M1]